MPFLMYEIFRSLAITLPATKAKKQLKNNSLDDFLSFDTYPLDMVSHIKYNDETYVSPSVGLVTCRKLEQ